MNAIMKQLLSACFAVFLGTLFTASACHADTGSAGKEFYFTFQPNFGWADDLSVIIAADEATAGTLEIEELNLHVNFTVTPNRITTVALPREAATQAVNQVRKMVVHVTSEKKVTVYGLNRRSGVTDGFLALPVEALGTEYYALAYYGVGQLSLIGAYDNTVVSVTSPIWIHGRPPDIPFQITLNKGESIMFGQNVDFSGVHIASSAPLGVITSGDVNIPYPSCCTDYSAEMMPPVSTWGKSFMTVPFATRKKGDLFRVMASQDNTSVMLNGTLVATLKKGAFYETILETRSYITTSAPAMAMQYAMGTEYDQVDGDPFSMVLVPAEQFLDHYTISTPQVEFGFTRQFVNVVIPSGAVGDLTFDGQPVDPALFTAIATSGFSGGQVPAGPGPHTLNSKNGVPFGAYVYGFGFHDGYGYPGGMSFKAINSAGDPYPPGLRLIPSEESVQGSATDSEDADANGILGAGEDRNSNGKIDFRSEDTNGNGRLDDGEDTNSNQTLDRDTGIFKVELLPGASNLQVNILPFVPGVMAVQFSVTRIDPAKPGVGILHVEDGAGNKAEAPIEIGAVAVLKDVRAVLTMSTLGIDILNNSFKKQPFSITEAAGKKMIEWRFDSFKADSVADLGFDVVLNKPVGGENRIVSHQFDLYYKDANGKEVHSGLDTRSVAVQPGNYVIAPATDKGSYSADEMVRIASVANNVSSLNGWFGVRLSLRDASGGGATPLGTLPNHLLSAGAAVNYAGIDLPASSIQVGNYVLIAELTDADGNVAAVGTTAFTVASAAQQGVRAALASDRQTYAPFDTAVLTARVTNVLANEALNNAVVTMSVRNFDGSVRMTKTETVAQIAPGASRDLRYSVPLAQSVPGRQNATLTVTSADGKPLGQAAASFVVTSSADTGAGITGSVLASAKTINIGDSLALMLAATNEGNSTISAMPMTLTIVDPVDRKIMAEFPYALSLSKGQSFHAGLNWIGEGVAGREYLAVLSLQTGGKKLTLGQDTFTLLAAQYKLDISQRVANGNRVLVLVSCKADEPDYDSIGYLAACITERAQTIGKALVAAGASYAIATDEAQFKQELRSGRYNTYWISGKQDKLHDALASEVREAAFRGDGVIMDSEHDQRNKVLDAVTGVRWAGKIGETDLPVAVFGQAFPQQTLRSVGRALKSSASTGTVQANFAGSKPNSGGPAIVSNSYGSGRAMLYAFDMAGSLRAVPGWQQNLQASLKSVLRAPTVSFGPGAVVPFETQVTNLAKATGIQVQSALPPGATYLGSAPSGSYDQGQGTVNWSFPLAEKGSVRLALNFQLGTAPEAANVRTVVSTFNGGVATAYGDPLSVTLHREADPQGAAHSIALLAGLKLDSNRERQLRIRLLDSLKAAEQQMTLETRAGHDAAIVALIGVIDGLSGITAADTVPVHISLDLLLKDAQWQWSRLPAK